VKTGNAKILKRKKVYSNFELLNDLRKAIKEIGRFPRYSEYDDAGGKFSIDTFRRRFGSWDAALKATKIETKPKASPNQPLYSETELLEDLRRVAAQLGRQPHKTEYDKLGKFSGDNYRRRFGSWKKAIEKAGLMYRPQHKFQNWTPALIKEDLQSVKKMLGRFPTVRDYYEFGKTSCNTVYRHAETNKWGEVLAKFLDLDPELIPAYSTVDPNRYRTTRDRLEELRQLAKRLKRTPTTAEARKYKINVEVLRKRCGGTWEKVVEMAGLSKPMKKQGRK
jgi:hypothetical protein